MLDSAKGGFMRVPLSLMLAALILLVIAWVSIAGPSKNSIAEASPTTTESIVKPKPAPMTLWEEPLDVDPPEQTLYIPPPEFPNKEQLVLIGRIADGIWKERTYKGKTPYFVCGEAHKDEAAKEKAMEVAYHVVRAAWLASDDRRTLNVWGWAGTLLNEGGMDICTLGMNPRKAAYKLGVLKPRRRTLSHTKEDVIRAINHPRMKALFKTYDLGMGQTLDIYYRRWAKREGIEGVPEDLLEWKGFYWQAIYMHGLAVRHNTDRPWMYWPGYRAPWKDYRVYQHARKLGATKEEIGPITPGDWNKPKHYGVSALVESL
jgi:hypothetical protein